MSRRGRKRGTTSRHPGGKLAQPSDAERERDILAAGFAARERIHGLSPSKASRPEAGTAFGRAYLAGELHPNNPAHNQALYDSGLEFERRRRAYRRALQAHCLSSPGNLDRKSGFDGDESPNIVEACQRAERAYAEIRAAILECGQPLAMFALECWILEDRPMDIGPLRSGLNAIWRVVHMSRPHHVVAA
jgi:hypothetical protein